jgi:hypothetical protein
MAWREPTVDEEDLSPLERLRQEIKRPRTYADIWKEYTGALRDQGIELDEHADEFNLSATKNTMEMK